IVAGTFRVPSAVVTLHILHIMSLAEFPRTTGHGMRDQPPSVGARLPRGDRGGCRVPRSDLPLFPGAFQKKTTGSRTFRRNLYKNQSAAIKTGPACRGFAAIPRDFSIKTGFSIKTDICGS